MFQNRTDAGIHLAEKIRQMTFHDAYILAIPRGGIIVAAPVSQALRTGIRTLVVRKIGLPQNPELAIGSVMPDSSAIFDQQACVRFGITAQQLHTIIRQEYAELKRRLTMYPGFVDSKEIPGKTAILIDDGVATGYTVKAAVQWLRTLAPAKTIIAVPVAPPEAVKELRQIADEVICLLQPEPFWAVGQAYEDFSQVRDDEVIEVLLRHK